ncbi:hypothetical protein K488DRAFT_90609 [Vararia minispora EC-137]|uniref:Uncharacterized protein n=1 Tax=Vararia minispora EC-137 TaxID=1314806 RepID=A0ACB8Q7M0_9AGAM|nr:hypothetical protein K488DRAFT_90609 [Vararia minispora EC-137]
MPPFPASPPARRAGLALSLARGPPTHARTHTAHGRTHGTHTNAHTHARSFVFAPLWNRPARFARAYRSERGARATPRPKASQARRARGTAPHTVAATAAAGLDEARTRARTNRGAALGPFCAERLASRYGGFFQERLVRTPLADTGRRVRNGFLFLACARWRSLARTRGERIWSRPRAGR